MSTFPASTPAVSQPPSTIKGTLLGLDSTPSTNRRSLLPEHPGKNTSVVWTRVSQHTPHVWQWPLLTFNLRQTQFASQDLLLVLPFGLFCKILLAKLLVGLHLAVLGDGIVHDADNERPRAGGSKDDGLKNARLGDMLRQVRCSRICVLALGGSTKEELGSGLMSGRETSAIERGQGHLI